MDWFHDLQYNLNSPGSYQLCFNFCKRHISQKDKLTVPLKIQILKKKKNRLDNTRPCFQKEAMLLFYAIGKKLNSENNMVL